MDTNKTDSPALAPPDGVSSSFDRPSIDGSLQTTIVGTLAVCILISTASAIARAVAQLYLFRRPVWADLWIWLAWASHVVFAAMLLVSLPYGAGFHQWNVRLESYYRIKFYLYVSFVLYDLAIAGAKVAILLQLSSLFAGSRHNRFYWVSLTLILANLIFYVAISFALIFQCQPLSKAWDPTVAGSCLDQDALLTSSGPFNIISDFLIFLLPIWAIWQLHLPLRRRLEVISAFAVGLFGCMCSAVRVAYSNRLSKSGDITWTLMQNQLWANAEITAGILIASIFIMPRFVRQVRGRADHYSYHNYCGSSNTYSDGAYVSNRSTWNAGRVMTHSKHFSRDPYIELEESERVGQDPIAIVEDSKDALPRGRTRKRESRLNGVSAPSLESTSTAEGGIVKTVEIKTTEEHVKPQIPEPVALPGATI